MNEKFYINLVVGDWSGDGHCQTKTIQVQSSLNMNELQAVYKKAAKKTKVQFVDAVAAEYENNMISEDDFKKLQSAGIVMDEIFFRDENGEWDYSLDETSFATLYLEMIKLVHPTFVYTIVDNPGIMIGGYGLFSGLHYESSCPNHRWYEFLASGS